MYNEIGSSTNNATLISNLSTFVHSLDPTRYTSADTDDGSIKPRHEQHRHGHRFVGRTFVRRLVCRRPDQRRFISGYIAQQQADAAHRRYRVRRRCKRLSVHQQYSASAAGHDQPLPSRKFAKQIGGNRLCSVCVAELSVEHRAVEHDRFFHHHTPRRRHAGPKRQGPDHPRSPNVQRQLLLLPGQLERSVAQLGQHAGAVYFRSYLDRPHHALRQYDRVFKSRRTHAVGKRRANWHAWCRWCSMDLRFPIRTR